MKSIDKRGDGLKKVIIAEKPSVAKNIADAFNIKTRRDGYFENDKYLITWAFGHLLQLYDAKDYDEKMKYWKLENFPFIPAEFKYKVKQDSLNKQIVDRGAEKQIQILESLINRDDVDEVISATDYDREGQVIADEIFLYLDVQKPIYRLLLNEWTSTEINKGMKELKPNSDMKPLQDAGIGRQWADWIIGINLTSVATLKYNLKDKSILNIGRVLLPTLKIVYDRDMEIERFKSTSYYKLSSVFKTDRDETFEGLYYENNSEKFKDREYLDKISSIADGKRGVIVDKETEKKKEYPPYLFNLSNLQGHITSKYSGWTSDKVLKVAQSLYEKKFITYPRTGSVVLDESLEDRARNVLDVLKVGLPYSDDIVFVKNKRVFNSSKVESHSAIMPTYMKPSRLSGDEETVYEAVKNRFVMQFMPLAEAEETKITVEIEDESIKGSFISKGKVQVVEGWRVVERIETKDTILPLVSNGETVDLTESSVVVVVKKPPKLHSEKTLLRAMETCGKAIKDKQDEDDIDSMMTSILSGFSIGTPATRAETINKLKNVGYISTKGKSLTCTELGKNIVEIFPAKELLDLEYTGKLEKTLSDMEKGVFKKEDFLNLIVEFTENSVKLIKNDTSWLCNTKVSISEDVEVLGSCPICSNPVIEGEKGFGCSNWKNGCKFTVWKDDRYINSFGKKVSVEMVKLLLQNGKVGFRNLKSKKGNLFSAYFRYELDSDTGYFSWKIEFIDS